MRNLIQCRFLQLSRTFPQGMLVWFAVLFAGLSGPSFAQKAAPAAPQAVAVSTVIAREEPVAQTKDYVGRVQAIDRVQVRARITGYLEAVLFKEGDFVKEGQPLYSIEPGLFQAAVEQAQAALEGAKASKILTKVQLERATELLKQTYGTPQKRDEALAADENAAANILKAQADLDTAKINLGYTTISSPVTGKISRTLVTKGNVVSPDSGVLTTIVSQDPMYVLFPVSRRDLLGIRGVGGATDGDGFTITIRFSNGAIYPHKGKIDFRDVIVDQSTDTVNLRATIPNPDGVLIDGELVRVNVDQGKPQERIVVPQSAFLADQQGTYVFAVEDGKAVVRRVKLGGEAGQDFAVLSGVKAGEQIIVEGLTGIRPGAPVLASPLPEPRS